MGSSRTSARKVARPSVMRWQTACRAWARILQATRRRRSSEKTSVSKGDASRAPGPSAGPPPSTGIAGTELAIRSWTPWAPSSCGGVDRLMAMRSRPPSGEPGSLGGEPCTAAGPPGSPTMPGAPEAEALRNGERGMATSSRRAHCSSSPFAPGAMICSSGPDFSPPCNSRREYRKGSETTGTPQKGFWSSGRTKTIVACAGRR
mmetsp:Transcript_86262/g.279273  ORF Transcript_86262/g.279273 Transcript_86262/m.279273 type:complete len:204 (-) Transcript_86262:2095-2706(-)